MLAQSNLPSGNSLRFFGGPGIGSLVENNQRGSWSIQNALCFGENVSWPQGFNNTEAIKLQVENSSDYGNLAVTFKGVGTSSFNLDATGELAVTLVGNGITDFNAEEAHERSVAMSGEGTLAADLEALGILGVTMDAGTRPSAYDIAQEVWQAQKTSFTLPGSMGKTLADMDAVAIADLILNDPRFLTVAKYLGLK